MAASLPETPEDHSRRWKRFVITPECWINLALGREIVTTKLPGDVRAVGFSYEPSPNTITIYLESAEYERIPFGGIIPVEPLKTSRKIWN